jgi:hypothetical protein
MRIGISYKGRRVALGANNHRGCEIGGCNGLRIGGGMGCCKESSSGSLIGRDKGRRKNCSLQNSHRVVFRSDSRRECAIESRSC